MLRAGHDRPRSARRRRSSWSPGWCSTAILLADWISHGFRLTELSYFGVLGLLLIVLGFQTFTFTILLQMLGRRGAPGDREPLRRARL